MARTGLDAEGASKLVGLAHLTQNPKGNGRHEGTLRAIDGKTPAMRLGSPVII